MSLAGWLEPVGGAWWTASEALQRAVRHTFGGDGDSVVAQAAAIQRLEWEGRAPQASLGASRLLEAEAVDMPLGLFEAVTADLALNLALRGRFDEAFSWAERGVARIRGAVEGPGEGPAVLSPLAGALRALLGSADDSRAWLSQAAGDLYRDDTPSPRRLWALLCLLLSQLRTAPQEAEVDALLGRWQSSKVGGGAVLLRPLPVVAAWVRVRRGCSVSELRADLSRVDRVATVASLDCHRQALHARLALLEGRADVALRRASRAEELSHEVDNRFTLLESHVVRAHVYRGRGWHAAARRDAEQAVSLAQGCGIAGFARALSRTLGVDDRAALSGPAPPATLERVHRQLDVLLHASAAWTSLTDPEQLLRRMLDEAVSLLGAERALLFLADGAELAPSAGRDAEGRDLGQAAAFSRTAVARARAEGEVVLVCDDDDTSAWDSLAANDLRSVVAAPLRLGERVLGVLYADTRMADRSFGPDEVAVVRALAGHMALGLEQARAARLAVELAETRQRFLTAQIRPHFLFNALNSIASLVTVDAPRAERLIVSLSRFLRQSLATQSATTSIDEELKYLRAYLDIEAARFGSRLRVQVDIDDAARLARIPSMSLQPLVENAIRHGVTARPEGGTVTVRVQRVGEAVEVVVSDDGVGFEVGAPRQPPLDTERGGAGVGLGNVRDRVLGLFGASADFRVESAVGEGTRVSFRVPA